MTNIVSQQVKGLIPLVDRKKVGEPFCCDGRNFCVDVDGPLSGYGKTQVQFRDITAPEYVQSFDVNGQSFIFIQNAVLTFDTAEQEFVPVLVFTELSEIWPWTMGELAGNFYFARKNANLIEYNSTTDVWAEITGGDTPTDIYAVTQSAGRLIVLSRVWVNWTAIDSLDFTTSTVTGAGAQALSMIGTEEPITVLQTDDGYIVYSNSGMLKADAVNSIIPFRHYALDRKRVPLNPYCVAAIENNQHVFITDNGIFATGGKKPEPWQPLMAEYLHSKIITDLDTEGDNAVVRITYSPLRSWLLISLSESSVAGLYTRAFVLYLPSDEWGVLNQIHTGFIDIDITTGPNVGFPFALVNNIGKIHLFADTAHDAEYPLNEDLTIWQYVYLGKPVYPARYEQASIKFPTVAHCRDIDEVAMDAPGLYNLESVVEEAIAPIDQTATEQAATPGATIMFPTTAQGSVGFLQTQHAEASRTLLPLDAEILVGPFRLTEGVTSDEFNQITNMSVQMLDSSIGDTFEDYMLDYDTEVEEDWLTATGDEDWGFGSAGTTEYQVGLISTLDAYKTYENMDKVPDLLEQDGRTRFLDCDNNGIYHLVKFTADVAGESFHLKFLELTGNMTGRLS